MPVKLKVLMVAMFATVGLIILSFFIDTSGITGLGANIADIFKIRTDITTQGEGELNQNLSSRSDIDKDGLFDEEEILYRTDPLNPDTDGDGFLDGEEVAAGCSPIVPGPDDCGERIEKLRAGKSLTEELSDLITGGIIAGDLKLDNPDFAKSILSLRNQAFTDSQILLTIDEPLPNIIPSDDSKKSQQEYVDQLGSIFEKYLIATSKQIESSDGYTQEWLINLYSKNLKLLEELKAELSILPVPPSWLEFHKKALIFINESITFHQNIINFEKDPLKALLSLDNATYLQNQYRSIISEALYKIKEQGLTLESKTILYFLSNQK